MSLGRPRLDPLRAGAALAALLVLGAVRLACVGPGRAPEFLAGFGFDAGVVVGLWVAVEALAYILPARALAILFYPALLAACGLVFAHTWFFDVAIERRLTLLDLSWRGLGYFFASALPRHGLLAFLAMYVALGALAYALAVYLARRPRARSPRVLLSAGAALALALRPVLSAPRVASPLFDSARELWELASYPKLRPRAVAPDSRLLAVLDKSARTRAAQPTAYDKVIVLVMETMTAVNFERERARLSPGTFLQRERAHFHGFERYFPNNQDSRTGMLDMLFSRLIPYEAYSAEGVAGYEQLAELPSLVDRIHELSYQAAFAVAQSELEDVVGELSWDARIALSAPQIAAAREAGKLCFSPDEYEQSCEDLALLPALVEFVASHPRAFVYQEFIWGHASEYNEASGKTNAAYYSEYVDALLAALAARGHADDTLIVLTSDHGFRDRGRQHERDVYRIPLLFYAPRLAARSDSRLLSHTDFGLLLFEELGVAGARADDNPFVLVVGPTGQGHLFAVGPEGELLIREKLGLSLLAAQRGRAPLAPATVLGLFEAYRGRFLRR